MDIFNWVMANGGNLVAVLLSLHAAAVVVVNMTPTPDDDAALAKVYTVIEWLAGIFTAKVKQ